MATKTASVEVLTPHADNYVASRHWNFVKNVPYESDVKPGYNFDLTQPIELQYNKLYKAYFTCYVRRDLEPPNAVLVDADDLARFKTAFQTVVRQAEKAQTALARSRYAESRAIGEQLRQALLTLFQPPAQTPASTAEEQPRDR